MQIVIEEIDNIYYADVILTPNDIQNIIRAEMVCSEIIYKHRKCYVGVRSQGTWDNEEKDARQKESREGDEGIWGKKAPQRSKGRPRREQ